MDEIKNTFLYRCFQTGQVGEGVGERRSGDSEWKKPADSSRGVHSARNKSLGFGTMVTGGGCKQEGDRQEVTKCKARTVFGEITDVLGRSAKGSRSRNSNVPDKTDRLV